MKTILTRRMLGLGAFALTSRKPLPVFGAEKHSFPVEPIPFGFSVEDLQALGHSVELSTMVTAHSHRLYVPGGRYVVHFLTGSYQDTGPMYRMDFVPNRSIPFRPQRGQIEDWLLEATGEDSEILFPDTLDPIPFPRNKNWFELMIRVRSESVAKYIRNFDDSLIRSDPHYNHWCRDGELLVRIKLGRDRANETNPRQIKLGDFGVEFGKLELGDGSIV